LYYFTNGEVRAFPFPDVDEKFLTQISPNDETEQPITVSFREQTFRILTKHHPDPNVAYVQVVRNVRSEIDLLSLLQRTLIFGGIIFVLVAIGVGRLLANYALKPIQSAWKQQEQFVADASHELRTPLAIFQSTAENLLLHPERSVEQESEKVVRLLKESKGMTRLVDDLLMLAKGQSSQEEMKKSDVSLTQLVENLDQYYTDVCMLSNKKWRCEVGGDIRLICDELHIRRMLLNLIDNAIKFTPEQGEISLRVKQNAKQVEIQVHDTGIGIVPDKLDRIFDRFYTIDDARSAKHSHGLGLSIVKWIVSAHQGSISVTSIEQHGTQFSIQLPKITNRKKL
ncbi:MAG: sensor histidine kinase, partial [Bacilli bacterium]